MHADLNDEYRINRCAVCNVCEMDASNLENEKFKGNLEDKRCGHRFCFRCIQRKKMDHRIKFQCPKCPAEVNLNKLKAETFNEVEVSKDFSCRRKILGIYNKKQDNFESLYAYNEYLEMVEDTIFDLVHYESGSIEVKEREAQIAKYLDENRLLIAENRIQAERDHDAEIERERESKRQTDQKLQRQREFEQAEKEANKIRRSDRNSRALHGTVVVGAEDSNDITSQMNNTGPASSRDFTPSLIDSILRKRPEPKRMPKTAYTSSTRPSSIAEKHRAGGYSQEAHLLKNKRALAYGVLPSLDSTGRGRHCVTPEEWTIAADENYWMTLLQRCQLLQSDEAFTDRTTMVLEVAP